IRLDATGCRSISGSFRISDDLDRWGRLLSGGRGCWEGEAPSEPASREGSSNEVRAEPRPLDEPARAEPRPAPTPRIPGGAPWASAVPALIKTRLPESPGPLEGRSPIFPQAD